MSVYRTVSEIFSVKKWRDLEAVVVTWFVDVWVWQAVLCRF